MSARPAARAASTAAGGRVLVTATMRTDAGSRPARRAESATACRTAARRAAISSRKETRLLERSPHLDEREPDHVGERALDGLDQPRPEPLDGVGARLVVALAARHVALDGARVEAAETDPGQHHLGRVHASSRPDEREAGGHAMLASGELPDHARGVAGVGGLAEHDAALLDDRVGGEHPVGGPPRRHRRRLRARQAEDAAVGPAQGGAAQLVAGAAAEHPVLADYVLYFQARAARAAGHPDPALESVRRLVASHPDSIWVGPAWLMAGQLERAGGDLAGARASLTAARAVLPAASGRWPSATLSLAEVEGASGEPAAALELARELRRARPRGLAARRARRLAERLRAAHPELPFDHADEAEMRLKEGDARGAREQAEMALAGAEPLERARILWVRAQAERALGLGTAAEATCLELARETSEPLAPRALTAAAGWRWNADDDAGALRLFGEVLRRFPDSAAAPDALYATP